MGACLVRDGELLAAGHNSVIGELDITAHAEVVVIRAACRESRSLDLAGSTLYVTVEPCPMCLAACHYAGISNIVFGASIQSLHAITGDELCRHAEQVLGENSALVVTGGLLTEQADALLEQWSVMRQASMKGRRA